MFFRYSYRHVIKTQRMLPVFFLFVHVEVLAEIKALRQSILISCAECLEYKFR